MRVRSLFQFVRSLVPVIIHDECSVQRMNVCMKVCMYAMDVLIADLLTYFSSGVAVQLARLLVVSVSSRRDGAGAPRHSYWMWSCVLSLVMPPVGCCVSSCRWRFSHCLLLM